jgi:hypothetical protein
VTLAEVRLVQVEAKAFAGKLAIAAALQSAMINFQRSDEYTWSFPSFYDVMVTGISPKQQDRSATNCGL